VKKRKTLRKTQLLRSVRQNQIIKRVAFGFQMLFGKPTEFFFIRNLPAAFPCFVSAPNILLYFFDGLL